jgi:hypothetical protein
MTAKWMIHLVLAAALTACGVDSTSRGGNTICDDAVLHLASCLGGAPQPLASCTSEQEEIAQAALQSSCEELAVASKQDSFMSELFGDNSEETARCETLEQEFFLPCQYEVAQVYGDKYEQDLTLVNGCIVRKLREADCKPGFFSSLFEDDSKEQERCKDFKRALIPTCDELTKQKYGDEDPNNMWYRCVVRGLGLADCPCDNYCEN